MPISPIAIRLTAVGEAAVAGAFGNIAGAAHRMGDAIASEGGRSATSLGLSEKAAQSLSDRLGTVRNAAAGIAIAGVAAGALAEHLTSSFLEADRLGGRLESLLKGKGLEDGIGKVKALGNEIAGLTGGDDDAVAAAIAGAVASGRTAALREYGITIDAAGQAAIAAAGKISIQAKSQETLNQVLRAGEAAVKNLKDGMDASTASLGEMGVRWGNLEEGFGKGAARVKASLYEGVISPIFDLLEASPGLQETAGGIISIGAAGLSAAGSIVGFTAQLGQSYLALRALQAARIANTTAAGAGAVAQTAEASAQAAGAVAATADAEATAADAVASTAAATAATTNAAAQTAEAAAMTGSGAAAAAAGVSIGALGAIVGLAVISIAGFVTAFKGAADAGSMSADRLRDKWGPLGDLWDSLGEKFGRMQSNIAGEGARTADLDRQLKEIDEAAAKRRAGKDFSHPAAVAATAAGTTAAAAIAGAVGTPGETDWQRKLEHDREEAKRRATEVQAAEITGRAGLEAEQLKAARDRQRESERAILESNLKAIEARGLDSETAGAERERMQKAFDKRQAALDAAADYAVKQIEMQANVARVAAEGGNVAVARLQQKYELAKAGIALAAAGSAGSPLAQMAAQSLRPLGLGGMALGGAHPALSGGGTYTGNAGDFTRMLLGGSTQPVRATAPPPQVSRNGRGDIEITIPKFTIPNAINELMGGIRR